MPKKTKKHKIEARRHRLQKKHEVTYTYSVSEQSKNLAPEIQDTQVKEPKKSVFQNQEQQTGYFRNDLLKSLMITMIILCIQAALYVAQISGKIDITNLKIF